MLRPTGYLQIGDGRVSGKGRGYGPFGENECDTFTCSHCNTIVFVKPKCDPADMGGLCKTCMGLICPRCANKGGCDPHEEKLKRIEARYQFLKDAGLA